MVEYVMRPPEHIVKARRKEIALRYARRSRESRRRTKAYAAQFAAIRIAEINRLIDHWYGGPLPNDKDGRRFAYLVANHLAVLRGRPRDRLADWCSTYAPWMQVSAINAIVARIAGNPIRWRADTLARQLGLNMKTRTLLRITTIGATDCDQAERKALRKAKDREQARLRRMARKMLNAIKA